MKTTEERFFAKVAIIPFHSCWEWIGAVSSRGRGNFYADGRTYQAHIYSFKFHKGNVPKGLNVLHTCDNGRCVNPEHLFAGTQSQNIQQMHDRNRAVGHQRGDGFSLARKSRWL